MIGFICFGLFMFAMGWLANELFTSYERKHFKETEEKFHTYTRIRR
jgi:hypothetical protein